MMRITPRFIKDKNGKVVSVLIPYKQSQKILDKLEDYYDYVLAKERSKNIGKTYTFEEVKRELDKK
jgi:hypothetical protein